MRLLYFVTDIADVVVAQVVIDADTGRGAEAEQHAHRHRERARREVERAARIEVKRPAHDDDGGRQDRSGPERDRQRADRLDPAIQQRDVRPRPHHGNADRCRRRHVSPDVPDVVRESDVAGGDLERAAENELPDEQERHQAAPRRGAIGGP